MREFLTVKEVAEQLHTTERTVRELIKKRASLAVFDKEGIVANLLN